MLLIMVKISDRENRIINYLEIVKTIVLLLIM